MTALGHDLEWINGELAAERAAIALGPCLRVSRLAAPALAGVLVLGSATDAMAQDRGGEPRSRWYVGGAAGVNWASDINQRGSNRDTLCYPGYACFDEEPRPEQSGYRWAYDLTAGAGIPFELAAGFILDRARLELSFGQRRNGIEQVFRRASDFEGNPLEIGRSTIVSNSESWIDNLTVRTLAISAYYDFGNPVSGFSPYVGVGIGPAFARLRGLHFAQEYVDTADNDAAYNPPLSHYTSRQDADPSDTVLAGHLHAGADLVPADRMALGVKLTYTMLGDIETTGTYQVHAQHAVDPDFASHTAFTGTRYWTLLFTVRYVLGG